MFLFLSQRLCYFWTSFLSFVLSSSSSSSSCSSLLVRTRVRVAWIDAADGNSPDDDDDDDGTLRTKRKGNLTVIYRINQGEIDRRRR